MLSMGEDLKDEREKPHRVQESPSPQDVRHSFSMLRTVPKHGGASLHFIMSIEKDGNSTLALSLFIDF
jgi:hypothetical protein